MASSPSFAAAFESPAPTAAFASHNPYMNNSLGSVYGEDTAALLDDDPDTDEEAGLLGPRPPVPARLDRGPPLKPTSCERFAGLFLCYNEWVAFRRVDKEVIDPAARRLVKAAFLLHWLCSAGYLVNFLLFSALFAADELPTGPAVTRYASFTAWALSLGLLLLGSLLGWHLWCKVLFHNLRTEEIEPSWRWFNAFYMLQIGVAVFCLIGAPGSGTGGLLALLHMTQWATFPVFPAVCSTVFIVLQVSFLIGGVLFLRSLNSVISYRV